MEVSEAERQEVISRCKEFLSKVWDNVNDDQIKCHRITSGVLNKTFRVWIKDLKISENNYEDKDVIVRLYNNGIFKKENKLKFNDEVAEVIVQQRLSELGRAPQILGVFNGGRFEKYIESRPTTADDLKSLDLSKEVIRKLANFHKLTMPLPKKPRFIEKLAVASIYGEVSKSYLEKYPNEIKEAECILSFPVETELSWMQCVVPKVGHKVVFSHNDFNPNNILLKENAANNDDKLIIIDYEMCSYFYRAYDLAYFLRMKRSRSRMQSGKITVTFDEDDPSVMDALLVEYLDECRKINESDFDSKYDNLERLRMEVEFFDLVVDLFMIAMGKCIILESNIVFPINLCYKTVCEYDQKKQSLLKKYGNPLVWETNDC